MLSPRTLLTAALAFMLLLCAGCKQAISPSEAPVPVTPPPAQHSATPTPLQLGPAVSVPEGQPLSIDGTMGPGEWDAATVDTFADGSKLYLMASGGYLYLAIRASTPEMIAGNILLDRGESIAVLHSSAALGTAVYERRGEIWRQTQDFVWRCRQTGDSATALAERAAFLEDDRWVAANSRMGKPNELEYQIEVTTDTLRLAANILRSSDVNVRIPWPRDLTDDCIRPMPGGWLTELQFAPGTWATLTMPWS